MSFLFLLKLAPRTMVTIDLTAFSVNFSCLLSSLILERVVLTWFDLLPLLYMVNSWFRIFIL